jgi:polyisoprenyl-teichoic acid--peptidoglycan teichoic acid transferase
MSAVGTFARRYLIALAITVTLVAGGLVGVNIVYDRKIANIETIDLELDDDTDLGEPANFLVIGSDTRAFVDNATQEEAFGDPEVETGQRSDTIMVVRVDPENQTATIVSFPRDLVVDIPNEGEQKINAAYNAGPQRVVDTLKANFGIDIHHYLEVDFQAFEGIVNAIGGVPVYFAAPAKDEKTGFLIGAPDFDLGPYFGWLPGCYELDGAQALAYARSRGYEEYIDYEWVPDEKNDLGRIQRQQDFMLRLAAEAVAKALANPLAANNIANEGLAQLTKDEELSRSDINKLIQAFRRVDPNDRNSIQTLTMPGAPQDGYADLGSVLILDEALAQPILDVLRSTEPAPTASGGPPPTDVRLRVLNGSGVGGAAAATADALVTAGFQGGGIGDNPDGNVDVTEVRYRQGSKAKAEKVRQYLGGRAELVEDETIVDADVLVVLGESFTGITPPGEAAPAPGAPAPPDPTASAPPESSGGAPAEAGPAPQTC